MIEISRYENLAVPAYALPYLVNGDASGLEEGEQKKIDNWYAQFKEEAEAAAGGGDVIFSAGDSEDYFSSSPEFGPAGSVVDCTILIVK